MRCSLIANLGALDPMAFTAHVLNTSLHLLLKGLWRNGSASDSRSEGWEFESLWPHLFPFALSMSTHTENTKTYSKLKNPKNLRFGIDKPKANTANHCEPLYLEITNQQKNRVCKSTNINGSIALHSCHLTGIMYTITPVPNKFPAFLPQSLDLLGLAVLVARHPCSGRERARACR